MKWFVVVRRMVGAVGELKKGGKKKGERRQDKTRTWEEDRGGGGEKEMTAWIRYTYWNRRGQKGDTHERGNPETYRYIEVATYKPEK